MLNAFSMFSFTCQAQNLLASGASMPTTALAPMVATVHAPHQARQQAVHELNFISERSIEERSF